MRRPCITLPNFLEFVSEPFTSPLSEEEAWRWLLQGAQSCSVQAQYDAGTSLATGDWGERCVPQDLEAAVAWYRLAAEAGHGGAVQPRVDPLGGEGCERVSRPL